jgi:hypothetical protein
MGFSFAALVGTDCQFDMLRQSIIKDCFDFIGNLFGMLVASHDGRETHHVRGLRAK